MKAALIITAFLLTPAAMAQEGPSPPLANQQLPNAAQEAEAKTLMGTLRCIQCQGQSIADSDASMAAAMRSEIRERIAKGQSSDEVRQWMIGRYGEWISFQPALHGAGLVLWIAPLLILALGLFLARGLFRKNRL